MRAPSRACCAVLVAALAGGALAAPRDPLLEPFDPASDYGYDLAATAALEHTVELDGGGFTWPAGADAEADTVFLELRLRRTRGAEPALRARAAGVELHQVFERGARGRRFLDLSPFAVGGIAAGERVELIGDGAAWEPGAARLWSYRNPPVDGLRVLVLAPHPDDAEIAAFGLYSSAEADVVTVTAGDAGGLSFEALFPEAGEHYRMKGWIRTWDSITVPFFGGVEPGRARNLGFYDATLATLWLEQPEPVAPPLAVLDDPAWYRSLNVDPALRARPFAATWRGLVDDLAAELERVRPRVVVAAHPLLDRHLDHQFATLALIEALASWEGECELWLYTNHASGNEAWPLGPRSAMTGLPPWAGGALFFRRLYSHPLDPAGQRRKLIALEAMHDLRPFDPRDGASRRRSRAERRRAARYDYFRRAPRPNELFFVVSERDAVEVAKLVAQRGVEPKGTPSARAGQDRAGRGQP